MNSYLHQFLIRFNFKKYRWNYWATSRLSLSLSVCVRPKLVFRVDMEWSVLTDGYHYHRPMGLLAFGPISGQFDALSMYWWLPQRWSPRSWIGNPHRPCSRDGDKKMRGARGRGTETSQDFVRGFSPRFTGYPISNEGKKKQYQVRYTVAGRRPTPATLISFFLTEKIIRDAQNWGKKNKE